MVEHVGAPPVSALPHPVPTAHCQVFGFHEYELTFARQSFAPSAPQISKVQIAKFNDSLPNTLLPFRAPQLNFALCKLNFFIFFSLFCFLRNAFRAVFPSFGGVAPMAPGWCL
jgi:hypothetical protein